MKRSGKGIVGEYLLIISVDNWRFLQDSGQEVLQDVVDDGDNSFIVRYAGSRRRHTTFAVFQDFAGVLTSG